jgi:ADP-ribose pyrophosphatase
MIPVLSTACGVGLARKGADVDILRTERLTREEWVNLFVRTYRRGDREGRWVFASRRADPPLPARGLDAVVIVPTLLAAGEPPRLVVTREYRIPLGDHEYAFPAGLAEEGESPEQAARRELREETGLELLDVTRVSPVTYSSAGLTDEAVVIVFATARRPADCRQCLDETEDIEVLLLDYRQVCELCDSGKRVNGRAWPILYMFQQLGRLA